MGQLSVIIAFRQTPEERQRLDEAVAESGLSLSDYVRHCAGLPISSWGKHDVADFITEFCDILPPADLS